MKRKWGEKLHRISYMQSSLGLFGCSLLILLALFAASLLSGGGLLFSGDMMRKKQAERNPG